MRTLDYTDPAGRLRRVQLPDSAGDEEVELGIPVGPPDLEPLGLPEPLAVRLNNELHRRGLFAQRDVLARKGELIAAWQAALKVDAMELARLYAGET